MNAMTTASILQLTNTLKEIQNDSYVRVVILMGQGKIFCAGLDLKSVLYTQGRYGLDATQSYELQMCFDGVIRQIRNTPQIMIATVQGVAVGAGFGIALACDVRLASSSASFHVGAVRMGLSAGECGISYHLPWLIGASRGFDVMLSGQPIDSAKALHIGLFSQVCEEQLLEHSIAHAQLILKNSPFSVAHTKRVMWANLDATSLSSAMELENHTQVLGLMTQDFSEAALAFSEKRQPRFIGK
ncbi:MAG: enoyl-CoA hydratase [Limnohabitans sp.]|nr:enoyl-CoA hydratase [Limnohabitans sp.]